MTSPLQKAAGKEFVHPRTKKSYGLVRPLSPFEVFSTLAGQSLSAVAADECGNFFAVLPDGSIGFWDHETDELTLLAASASEFLTSCVDPAPVELDPTKVRSVWIDPKFAKSLGRNVPPDGWVKKKSQPRAPANVPPLRSGPSLSLASLGPRSLPLGSSEGASVPLHSAGTLLLRVRWLPCSRLPGGRSPLSRAGGTPVHVPLPPKGRA